MKIVIDCQNITITSISLLPPTSVPNQGASDASYLDAAERRGCAIDRIY